MSAGRGAGASSPGRGGGEGRGSGSGSGSSGGGSGRGRGWGREARVVLKAVGPHPRLWWASAGALHRMARQGWWHRAPFLPLPGEAYWRFRLETAYGGDGGSRELSPADVMAYLRWCQRSRPRRG